MPLKFVIPAIFLLSVFTLPTSAQSPSPAFSQLAEKLDTATKGRPAETAYLQTSKGTYETLEDLWFKAYVLDARSLEPSTRSRTLYVQLVGEQSGTKYKQERYEIKGGLAACHLFLPDSLPEGNYLLWAFTPWSIEPGNTELKAVRRIKIVKQLKVEYGTKAALAPPRYKGKIQLGLFPEGGHLVEGATNKVAFKAVDTLGMPVDASGTLFDGTASLLRFASQHAGMGAFEFVPEGGKTYHVRLDGQDTATSYPLPMARRDGISLRLVAVTGDAAEFLVSKKPGGPKTTVYLRGQSRGTAHCMAKVPLQDVAKVRMPLSDFPLQGIAEFTLFNEGLQPIAERLVYVHPQKTLNISATTDKDKYLVREKVTVKIKVSDSDGQPIMANLGASIYDRLYPQPNDPVNILSYFHLSSQLKGKLYDPAYYFDTKNGDRKEALDLLLLTQGWRRYVWGEGNQGANKSAPALYDGIPGEVHATKNTKEAKGFLQTIYCFCAEKDSVAQLIVAAPDGSFWVTPENFKACQGGNIYLKPLGPERFRPVISLQDPFKAFVRPTEGETASYPQAGEGPVKEAVDEYIDGHNTIKLAEVSVKAKGTISFRGKYLGQLETEAWHSSTSDYVCWICGSRYKKGNPFDENDIPILNCSWHTTDRSHKPEEGRRYGIRLGENVAGGYFTGSKIITYHYPKYTEEELLKMNNLTRVKAYYPNREFYQPNYDKDTLNVQEADFRNTLLWAPIIETDEKGEATLEFYCSDINSGFVGSIEGMGPDGLLGRQDFEFSVRKSPKPTQK